MPDKPTLEAIEADPTFVKLSPHEKRIVARKWIEDDPAWSTLKPQDQAKVTNKLLSRYKDALITPTSKVLTPASGRAAKSLRPPPPGLSIGQQPAPPAPPPAPHPPDKGLAAIISSIGSPPSLTGPTPAHPLPKKPDLLGSLGLPPPALGVRPKRKSAEELVKGAAANLTGSSGQPTPTTPEEAGRVGAGNVEAEQEREHQAQQLEYVKAQAHINLSPKPNQEQVKNLRSLRKKLDSYEERYGTSEMKRNPVTALVAATTGVSPQAAQEVVDNLPGLTGALAGFTQELGGPQNLLLAIGTGGVGAGGGAAAKIAVRGLETYFAFQGVLGAKAAADDSALRKSDPVKYAGKIVASTLLAAAMMRHPVAEAWKRFGATPQASPEVAAATKADTQAVAQRNASQPAHKPDAPQRPQEPRRSGLRGKKGKPLTPEEAVAEAIRIAGEKSASAPTPMATEGPKKKAAEKPSKPAGKKKGEEKADAVQVQSTASEVLRPESEGAGGVVELQGVESGHKAEGPAEAKEEVGGSPELQALHNHPARVKGFDNPKTRDSEINDYLQKLRAYAVKYAPDQVDKIDSAIDMADHGKFGAATVMSEQAIGTIHQVEQAEMEAAKKLERDIAAMPEEMSKQAAKPKEVAPKPAPQPAKPHGEAIPADHTKSRYHSLVRELFSTAKERTGDAFFIKVGDLFRRALQEDPHLAALYKDHKMEARAQFAKEIRRYITYSDGKLHMEGPSGDAKPVDIFVYDDGEGITRRMYGIVDMEGYRAEQAKARAEKSKGLTPPPAPALPEGVSDLSHEVERSHRALSSHEEPKGGAVRDTKAEIARLKALGIDTIDVEEQLEELTGLRRSDFDSKEDFDDARQMTWDNLLSALEETDASEVDKPEAPPQKSKNLTPSPEPAPKVRKGRKDTGAVNLAGPGAPGSPQERFMAHVSKWLAGDSEVDPDSRSGVENAHYLAMRKEAKEHGVTLPDIARGKRALLGRLDLENRLGGLNPDASSSAIAFLSALPDKYLEHLGSSYVQRPLGESGEGVGHYDPVDRLITLSKSLLSSQMEPERVIPHEIAHHLERYVDKADLDTLEEEYQRQRARLGPTVKSAREAIEHTASGEVVGRRGETVRTNQDQRDFMRDSYRFKNFNEWFAEAIADRALRDHYTKNASAPARTAFGRLVQQFKPLVRGAVDFLRQQGKHAPAEKIYQKLLKGQYDNPLGPQRNSEDLFMKHSKRMSEAISHAEKIAEDLRRWTNPAGRSEEAARTARTMRYALAKQAQRVDALRDSLKSLRDVWGDLYGGNSEAKTKELWYAIDEGKLDTLSPEDKKIALFIKGKLKDLVDEHNAVANTLKKRNWRISTDNPNYAPRASIFKNPEEDEFVSQFGRRPLGGKRSHMKARTRETLRESLEGGVDEEGEPTEADKEMRFDNPWDALEHYAVQSQKAIFAMRLLADLEQQEVLHYVKGPLINEAKTKGFAPKNGERTGPLAEIDDNLFKRLLAVDTGNGPKVLKGSYMVPEPVANVLNNYLKPGYMGQPLFDTLRGLNNNINMLQLGWTAFHVTTTALNSVISDVALGFKQTLTPGERGAGIKRVATSWEAPIRDLIKGNRFQDAWYRRGAPGAEMMDVVEAAQKGGARVHMDRDYKATWFGKLNKTGQYIMEEFVPRVKTGAFMEAMQYEMRKEARRSGSWDNVSEYKQRKIAAAVWDSIDNRFGELVYDNTFMNRATKDALMLTTRAVGWNLGTWREAIGSVQDLRGLRSRPLQDALSHRMAYVAANVFVTAISGALMQKMMTGKAPWETGKNDYRDYFYPRTGEMLPRSKSDKKAPQEPRRVELPTYTAREWGPLVLAGTQEGGAVGVMHALSESLKNKMAPLPAEVWEMLSNQDYKGAPIADPNHTLWPQIKDYAKYVLKNLLPISFSQAAAVRRGPNVARDLVMTGLGVMQAPVKVDKFERSVRTRQVPLSRRQIFNLEHGLK